MENNLKLARQSYTAGQVELTVYLLVQEDLITTRLQVLEYIRDYLLSRAELERAAGGAILLNQIESNPPATSTQETLDSKTGADHD